LKRESLWPFAVLPAAILNLGAILLFAIYYGVQSQYPDLGLPGEGQLFFSLYVFIATIEWIFFGVLFIRLKRVNITWCSLLAVDERPFWFRPLPALAMFLVFNGIFAIYIYLVNTVFGGWPDYADWTPAQRIFMVTVVPITAAVTEEFIWRGYLLTRLLQRTTPWRAILLSAISFASIHGIMPDRFLVTLLLGVVAGYYYYKERKLLPLIATHMILDMWSFGVTAFSS
jgi:membrane protease YdiL (CAAX protease family)